MKFKALRCLLAFALISSAPLAGAQSREQLNSMQMMSQEISRLKMQQRWDEAEALARRYDQLEAIAGLGLTRKSTHADDVRSTRDMYKTIEEGEKLIREKRWDEAEAHARIFDNKYNNGIPMWLETVQDARKAVDGGKEVPYDYNAPDSLFMWPVTIFDFAEYAGKLANPDGAHAHNQRGIALHKAGDFTGALRAYELAEAAIDRAARTDPTERFWTPYIASNRGLAHWQLGDPLMAAQKFDRALEARYISPIEAPEDEKMALARARAEAEELHPLMSLSMDPGASAGTIGLLALLERKGVVLERQARSLAAFRQAANQAVAGLAGLLSRQELQQQLRSADRKLLADYEQFSRERSELGVRRADAAQEAQRASRIEELDRWLSGIQKTLAIGSISADKKDMSPRGNEARRQARKAARATVLQRLRERIPADAVLLEMVRYRPFDPRRPEQARWLEERYGTYVVQPNAEPFYIDLGEARRIDGLIQEFRRELARPAGAAKEAGRRLDELLMRPVRARIGNARQLLIAPESQLHLVPFQALVDDGDRFLVERYAISYLGSGRDLLAPRSTERPRSPPLIVADPNFGAGGVAAATTRYLDFANLRFEPLPGTAAEAQAIARILPDAVWLTGAQATETAVKRVAGPRILHIASHGFFLESESAAAGARGLGRVEGAASAAATPAPGEGNPMLRSGLVFAGVAGLRSGEDDGLLTGLEAALLDLRGTRLVVLSACETGVGDVRNAEGVFGLRRAFAVAGAETLVMSLWQVPDIPTMELMTGYYQALTSGATRVEALRQAQLALLKKPETAAPYHWAAFISSGDAGPMR